MEWHSTTKPLRAELDAALPQRPFTLRFWDGTTLPSTSGNGPVFSARSPRAVAHALLAPGQLGLSRAYVSGELAVDDIDAVLALLREWQPPAIDGPTRRRLLVGALRAAGATASSATLAPCATTTTSQTSSSRCSSATR